MTPNIINSPEEIKQQIAYYQNEAMEHLEKDEIYYARTALNVAIYIYEKSLKD